MECTVEIIAGGLVMITVATCALQALLGVSLLA